VAAPSARKGWRRYSRRSRGLSGWPGGDPRARRDAQAQSADWLRGRAPIRLDAFGRTSLETDPAMTVDRRGRLALNYPAMLEDMPKSARLRVLEGELDINPSEGVADLDAGSSNAQVLAKVNELMEALRVGGILGQEV